MVIEEDVVASVEIVEAEAEAEEEVDGAIMVVEVEVVVASGETLEEAEAAAEEEEGMEGQAVAEVANRHFRSSRKLSPHIVGVYMNHELTVFAATRNPKILKLPRLKTQCTRPRRSHSI